MTPLLEKNNHCKTRMSLSARIHDVSGKIGVPILLYFLGVPGIFVVLIWALFFRGK